MVPSAAEPARKPRRLRCGRWMGIAGPAGMPRDVVLRVNTEVNKALTATDVKTRLQDLGVELAGGTPEQLGSYMREQSAKMIKLARDAGIKPVD